MTFESFQEKVVSWATDRKIIQNGKPYTQTLKLISEFGELADALAKNDQDELIDAIGDCAVVCCILDSMTSYTSPLRMVYEKIENVDDAIIVALEVLSDILADISKDKIKDMLHVLQKLSMLHDLSFVYCCNHAWEEIKDRKGYLNENGVFIKER